MWRRWARVSDPAYAEKRWDRMSEKVRNCFIDEARIAIETYLHLSQN